MRISNWHQTSWALFLNLNFRQMLLTRVFSVPSDAASVIAFLQFEKGGAVACEILEGDTFFALQQVLIEKRIEWCNLYELTLEPCQFRGSCISQPFPQGVYV